MFDRTDQSFNDTNERSRRSMQSVWMSHWTRTSYNVTAETRNHISNASRNKELDHVTRQYHSMSGLEAPRSVKGLGEIETTTFEIINDNRGTSSRNLGNEGLGCEYIPMASPCTNGGGSSMAKLGQGADEALRPSFGHSLKSGMAVEFTRGIQFPHVLPGAQVATGTSSTEYHSLPQGTSEGSPVGRKTHSFAKDGSFAVSKPSQEYFVGSSSHIPNGFDNRKHEFDKGKTAISSFIDRSALVSNNQLANASLRTLEPEHCNIHRKSAFLVYGRQMDSHSQSGTSRNARFGESNIPMSLDTPSMSDGHLSAFGREWFQKIQKFSGMRQFPSQSSALEKSELKKSHPDCYSLEKLPNFVDDVETMRIYAAVDSLEGEPGGHSRFSQTTHSLLITKKTDVNLSKENDILRDRRVFTEFNGNKSSDFHNLPPNYGQGQRGVKLQALGSSTDNEAKENVKDVKASKIIIKNESSAETDTMDVDSFKEKNQFSAANSTLSNKVIITDSNLSPQINVASSREVGCCWSNMLPTDRNLELPALAVAAANSTDNERPSSSRTQSLDMDVLVAHATHPSNLKSNPVQDGSRKIDPSNRWVKRLKLSTSGPPAHGTKISDLSENPSPEKMSRFFRNIIKDNTTSLEPTVGNCCGKELMASDMAGDLSRKGEFTNVDPANNDKDLLLSHSWIQRWLRSGSTITQKKSKSMVIYEPQSSKLAMENLHEKQFPSVAAMALMGKAITGFQPCELQKRGSFIVWNTRAF
ncbi:uncharacterized protein Fot_50944 [Forsythia ovata]|uniref:F-box protein n=1 Tax=Forsythia ovata TaxID=205694 RepID=A0ABD1PZJ5_9LAMI